MSDRPQPSGVPPFSAFGEETVLVGLMFDESRDVAAALSPMLKTQDFFREQNRWVYEAALTAWRSGSPTTVPFVARQMQVDGTLDPAGAEPYLVELCSRHQFNLACTSTEALLANARVIVDYAQRRRGVARAGAAARDAMSGKAPAGGVSLDYREVEP